MNKLARAIMVRLHNQPLTVLWTWSGPGLCKPPDRQMQISLAEDRMRAELHMNTIAPIGAFRPPLLTRRDKFAPDAKRGTSCPCQPALHRSISSQQISSTSVSENKPTPIGCSCALWLPYARPPRRKGFNPQARAQNHRNPPSPQ